MNKEQLEVIKERANKATEGPWKIFEDSEAKGGCQIGTAWDHPQAKGPVGIVNLATSVTGGEIKNCVYIQSDDARFIAHARQDVPALIETVEKLMNVRDVSYAEYAELDAKNKELKEQRNALKFHLKVSSKALESEGEKADAFQLALEKIYDDIGILTSQEIYRIVEDALEGTTALGGDDND